MIQESSATLITDKSFKSIKKIANEISSAISIPDTIVFIGAGLSRKFYGSNQIEDGYLTMNEFIHKLFVDQACNMIDSNGNPILKNESPFSIIGKLESHNNQGSCGGRPAHQATRSWQNFQLLD